MDEWNTHEIKKTVRREKNMHHRKTNRKIKLIQHTTDYSEIKKLRTKRQKHRKMQLILRHFYLLLSLVWLLNFIRRKWVSEQIN